MTSEARLALSKPLGEMELPAAELMASTPRSEARAVMALVAGLYDHGVSVRDVVVVVRDFDTYERPLFQAALQYGLVPTFWTQLQATWTRPYALIESIFDVLGAAELENAVLLRPLEHRWCPPSSTSEAWPLDPVTVQTAKEALPSESLTLSGWRGELQSNSTVDTRFITYIDWLSNCPDPTPDVAAAVIEDVIGRYEALGLPETQARDSPALLEVEQEARAVLRVETLVDQIRHKFKDRLAEGTLERSWNDVADLCRLIVTQRPGHRKHSHALAVDVREANDMWFLNVPYVIAVGLVDGIWPQQTESAVPLELQEAVLRGEGRAEILAPRIAWTEGRDQDQFDDVRRAAQRGLIVTRHVETIDGNERFPSPLLDCLTAEQVSEKELCRLTSSERALPDAIQAMLPSNSEVSDDE